MSRAVKAVDIEVGARVEASNGSKWRVEDIVQVVARHATQGEVVLSVRAKLDASGYREEIEVPPHHTFIVLEEE